MGVSREAGTAVLDFVAEPGDASDAGAGARTGGALDPHRQTDVTDPLSFLPAESNSHISQMPVTLG